VNCTSSFGVRDRLLGRPERFDGSLSALRAEKTCFQKAAFSSAALLPLWGGSSHMIDQYVGGTRYDSELLTARVNAMRNADLVLIIRVFYDPYHPAGGHGQITDAWNQQVPVVSWSSTAQFDDWCDQCEEAAEGTWNDKLWLVPSSTWGYDWPPSGEPTHRPNVKCGLDLRRTRDRNQAHLRLRCYRLAAGAAYRSSMCAASAYQAPMCVHDPHRGYFDDADALPTQYFVASGDSHFQVTIAHEIGHWLGLNHVNQGGAGCVVG